MAKTTEQLRKEYETALKELGQGKKQFSHVVKAWDALEKSVGKEEKAVLKEYKYSIDYMFGDEGRKMLQKFKSQFDSEIAISKSPLKTVYNKEWRALVKCANASKNSVVKKSGKAVGSALDTFQTDFDEYKKNYVKGYCVGDPKDAEKALASAEALHEALKKFSNAGIGRISEINQNLIRLRENSDPLDEKRLAKTISDREAKQLKKLNKAIDANEADLTNGLKELVEFTQLLQGKMEKKIRKLALIVREGVRDAKEFQRRVNAMKQRRGTVFEN
ncbi:hypothetical protein [Leisingera caerulea]|uniref:Uncharacterized protein n=1 Tax=Leisingera caerulea TaxID=506591 RepID=A0A9Q9M1T9_LEICA|nr:hypothetical protein [Leisingera caerulea]UWQ54937.1 hypothetical protein K3721_05235 [Leisingera caerulea]